MELCERDDLRLEDSEEDDEEEEVENSEPLEDSDIQYSDSGNTHTTHRGLQNANANNEYCRGVSLN